MDSDTITFNFSNELDSSACSMQVLERLDFKEAGCNQFKLLVFGNVKWVFRRFAFIQTNIFFLKLKSILTTTKILCVKF